MNGMGMMGGPMNGVVNGMGVPMNVMNGGGFPAMGIPGMSGSMGQQGHGGRPNGNVKICFDYFSECRVVENRSASILKHITQTRATANAATSVNIATATTQ